MVKVLRLALFTFFITNNAAAQRCGGMSPFNNTKDGTRSWSKVVTTTNFFTLTPFKTKSYRDTAKPPVYSLFFHAASRVMFSDSMLAMPGKLVLYLESGDSLTWTNAKLSNDPIGALIVNVPITENDVRKLAANLVVRLAAVDDIRTSFKPARQQQLRKTMQCFLEL